MTARLVAPEELRSLLPPGRARMAIAESFSARAEGRLFGPLRTHVSVPEGATLLMPAFSERSSGLKVLHIRSGNPQVGLPSIVGEFLLFRRMTGEMLALLDGPELTGIRTAALAGHAARSLAPVGAEVGAVLGAGHQGYFQALALLEALDLREIRIYNRTAARARDLASHLAEAFPRVRVRQVATAGDAVRGAQVVTAATASDAPLILDEDVATDAHLNLMGAYRPEMSEAEPAVIARASAVYADDRDACLAEAGDVLQAVAAGAFATDQLLQMTKEPPRREGLTVFKSVGSAVFDLAAAEAAILVD